MPAKKRDEAPVRPGQHAAVQVAKPDADVYYLDEQTRERYEARK